MPRKTATMIHGSGECVGGAGGSLTGLRAAAVGASAIGFEGGARGGAPDGEAIDDPRVGGAAARYGLDGDARATAICGVDGDDGGSGSGIGREGIATVDDFCVCAG